MTTIAAQVIADSINPFGKRITTLQLRYPRFIHAEFMTHRAFSRNASSSRAIPVEKLIQDIIDDTAMPNYWGMNQSGMQALAQELPSILYYIQDDEVPVYREDPWIWARNYAINMAREYDKNGAHKQIVNRLLEPFAHINVVCTATEWANFFYLRDHPDAEPHIQDLARAMKEAMDASRPIHKDSGQWHLPYVQPEEEGPVDFWDLVKVSVARCARVSYLTHDGRETTFDEDLALYTRLVGSTPLHASPTEHQAEADTMIDGHWLSPELHGNFVGWNQYRKTLPGENYAGN